MLRIALCLLAFITVSANEILHADLKVQSQATVDWSTFSLSGGTIALPPNFSPPGIRAQGGVATIQSSTTPYSVNQTPNVFSTSNWVDVTPFSISGTGVKGEGGIVNNVLKSSGLASATGLNDFAIGTGATFRNTSFQLQGPAGGSTLVTTQFAYSFSQTFAKNSLLDIATADAIFTLGLYKTVPDGMGGFKNDLITLVDSVNHNEATGLSDFVSSSGILKITQSLLNNQNYVIEAIVYSNSTVQAVPEPSSCLLLASAAVLGLRKKNRNRLKQLFY